MITWDIDELMSEVSDEYRFEYANVVRRYVCCNFNHLSVNLSQDGLCSVIYNMVVLVKEDQLRVFERDVAEKS